MTKRWRLMGAIVLIASVLATVWHAYGSPYEEQPAVAPVSEPAGVGALGRVEPASRVRRLTQPGGLSATRLESLLVKEGQQVARGQILAEFADSTLKDLAVEQAEAALAEAEANLLRTRSAGRPSEVAAQRAKIEALAADLEYAKRDSLRTAKLLPSGAGTLVAADQSSTAVARLTAAKRQAEAELESLVSARPDDIALDEARVEVARAAVKKARAESDLSRLRAPMDGTILRIFTWPGEQISEDGILELGDLRKLDVVADIYETDVPRLRIGADAEIIVPGENRRFKARIYEIGRTVRRATQASTDPIAAVDSRTVEVRLALDPDGTQVLSGRSNMQVQVAIRP